MKCPHCHKAVELVAGGASRSESADASDVGGLLDRIDPSGLTDRESEFVEQTRQRYDQYKERIRISEKQLGWLRKIAEKGF